VIQRCTSNLTVPKTYRCPCPGHEDVCGAIELKRHSFLTSTPGGGEWLPCSAGKERRYPPNRTQGGSTACCLVGWKPSTAFILFKGPTALWVYQTDLQIRPVKRTQPTVRLLKVLPDEDSEPHVESRAHFLTCQRYVAGGGGGGDFQKKLKAPLRERKVFSFQKNEFH